MWKEYRKNKQKILPEGDTDVNLATKFVKYFHEQIMNIYNSFDVQNNNTGSFSPWIPI